MKFTLAPLALAMVLATVAFAQDTTSASETSASASESASESASASSSSASEPTASSDTASPTSAAAAPAESVCQLLPGYEEGNPQQVDYGCTFSSTSTPPYNAESLASYLIGAYRPGKEGEHIGDVATELAQSVTQLYPTLTVDFNAIASSYAEAISASISGVAQGTVTVDGAMGAHSNKILSVAGMAIAVVAGGAFLL